MGNDALFPCEPQRCPQVLKFAPCRTFGAAEFRVGLAGAWFDVRTPLRPPTSSAPWPFCYADTSQHRRIRSGIDFTRSDGVSCLAGVAGGYGSTSAITGVRLVWATGNFANIDRVSLIRRVSRSNWSMASSSTWRRLRSPNSKRFSGLSRR